MRLLLERREERRDRALGPVLLTAGALLDGDPPGSAEAAVLRTPESVDALVPILVEDPRAIATTILAVIWIYAATSIQRHFGFTRAAGADHFDPRYRGMPLVEEGIFRLTRNGMYVFGFLILWAIAIGYDSSAALVVAAFSHAYIWVHYHATEKPDMEYLYLPQPRSRRARDR